jgi:hypothetical protein
MYHMPFAEKGVQQRTSQYRHAVLAVARERANIKQQELPAGTGSLEITRGSRLMYHMPLHIMERVDATGFTYQHYGPRRCAGTRKHQLELLQAWVTQNHSAASAKLMYHAFAYHGKS